MNKKRSLKTVLIKGENGSAVRARKGTSVCFEDPNDMLTSVVANKIGERPYRVIGMFENGVEYVEIQGIRGTAEVHSNHLMRYRNNYFKNQY
jgi:hypothetical protein